MFVFAWHLAIAVFFTVVLYLAATYSSFRHLIDEIHAYRRKIDSLQQDPVFNEKLYTLYKEQYNRSVKDFNYRKTSIFAAIVLRLFTKLDVTFTLID